MTTARRYMNPKTWQQGRVFTGIIATLVTGAYLSHVVFMQPAIGWVLYVLAAGATGMLPRQAGKYIALVILGVGIMSITPVTTRTDPLSMLAMGGGMALAIGLPYAISHIVYRDSLVHFGLDFRRRWKRLEVAAVGFAVLSTAIAMPLYFATTDGATHWEMTSPTQIAIVFVAIMLIGMWEEFFFVALQFSILQRYVPFLLANVLQAAMFAGFLYQIGFRDWVVINTFLYALYQGYVFHKFRFLLCNVVIHACVDLIVFLALLHAVFPDIL